MINNGMFLKNSTYAFAKALTTLFFDYWKIAINVPIIKLNTSAKTLENNVILNPSTKIGP